METNEPVTLPAPVIPEAAPPRTKWEREYEAFKRLLPQLLPSYRGQYVAIHDERVVDSDPDEIALIQRVHSRYGYVPIHVDKVNDQPPRPERLPHYREYRRKANE